MVPYILRSDLRQRYGTLLLEVGIYLLSRGRESFFESIFCSKQRVKSLLYTTYVYTHMRNVGMSTLLQLLQDDKKLVELEIC